MLGEHTWRKIVTNKRQGVWEAILRSLFLPLSWIFRCAVFLRTWAYEMGLFRRYIPPVSTVISIGNIAVGGTGKTPMTLLLGSILAERATVAILYRGYRSKAEHLPTPLTLCRGKGPMFPAHYCGDEPYLVAKRLPHTHIFVGKDRATAARLAAESGAELVILDDGMQHLSLVRDIDIVILDSEDPLGQGYFLPRGLLREGKSALLRAHLLVFHPIEKQEQFLSLKQHFQPLCNCPMIGTNIDVRAVRTINGEDIGSLIGRSFGFFCGIAQPDRFRETILGLGASIIGEKILNDHDKISVEELEVFAKQMQEKGAEALLCTEKDCVKLPENLSLPIPIFWIDIALSITQGNKEWEKFLQQFLS